MTHEQRGENNHQLQCLRHIFPVVCKEKDDPESDQGGADRGENDLSPAAIDDRVTSL